jgi:hypothetical protein
MWGDEFIQRRRYRRRLARRRWWRGLKARVIRCHATMTRRRGAAATAFAPTACAIVEQSFGNRQTACHRDAMALPGSASNDIQSIEASASGTAAACVEINQCVS